MSKLNLSVSKGRCKLPDSPETLISEGNNDKQVDFNIVYPIWAKAAQTGVHERTHCQLLCLPDFADS
jgi:hypothetical protein